MNFKVISFYTEKYREVAERLRKSLDSFEIDYELLPVPSAGDWVKNCAMKPAVILAAWEASEVPVVWLDADAVVMAYPTLFGSITTDIACHFRCDKRFTNELLSGTLFFNKTEGALRILKAWKKRMNTPDEWDQRSLEGIINSMEDISIYRLPASYTKIFDSMPGAAVIEHFQESRKHR